MRTISSLLIFIFTIASLCAERTSLITSASQLTVSNIGEGSPANLIDGNKSTSLHSLKGELSEDCYIEIELNEELNLGDEEDLVVFLQRCQHNESDSHPTIFKVEGRTADSSVWEDWDSDVKSCHIYFLFRGMGTKEYSTRIHTSKHFRYLRFTVIANSGRQYDNQGHRYIGLSEFQIYRIGRNDNYTESLVDRFHLTTDYFRQLQTYKFKNTMGVLEPINRTAERNQPETGMKNWCDWNGWSADGKWTKDTDFLNEAGIKMPEYTMLTSENDGRYGYKPDPGQKRQPTHVTEHILYAIPGDAIALYPYYSFTATSAYLVNFSHWYDYQSGGNIKLSDEKTGMDTSLLDFLIDPSGVHISDDYGFFAGKELGVEIPLKISTPQEYINFVNAANAYSGSAWQMKAQITADLDFSDYKNKVPALGKDYFQGILDGNGHTVSNLVMEYPDQENIGLVAHGGNGATIRNLIIDSTCRFIGKNKVAAVFAEDRQANEKLIENVQVYATVEAKDGTAASIVGGSDEYAPNTTIRNCFAGGSVSGKKAAAVAISGTDKSDKGFVISNTVSVTEVSSTETVGNKFAVNAKSITNCYDKYEASGNPLPDSGLNSDSFVELLGDGWKKGSDGVDHAVPGIARTFTYNNENYGKIATFFCPRSPYSEEGTLQNLPFRSGEDEFVIAADFSQSFSHILNIDHDSKNIIEPIIQFRHIFRIRDGKEFAESFSGSPENNQEYVRKNVRRVSAREGVPFQIRLDSPIPQKGTTRSKYYYKISDIDYRRVCTMDVEVRNMDTGEIRRTVIQPGTGIMCDENGAPILDSDKKPIDPLSFYYGEEFDGQGSREVDKIKYNICGGGGKYYRMLKCDAPKAGNYLVRITGNDINGNPIYIYDPVTKGPSEDQLVVMEMQLTVLPESAACMVDEATLYGKNDNRYVHVQEEELEKAYGAPKQRLTFDEYVSLESLDNVSDYLVTPTDKNPKYSLKWPMPWDEVTYAFDYDAGRNYNMYRIASHSERTPYSDATSSHRNPDGTTGLYDRLYYKSHRLGMNPVKHGYFYYVNASADPGVMARLRLEELCMGSTIHVSAWIAEFSKGNERANVSFNFVAVLKDGERIPLHSFISGYLPKAAEWMNVYYSFVPNYTDAGIDTDMIDYYELELDNNCKNSESADYAIDNIRIYVASPMLYATQSEPICDRIASELNVRIESPFDVMLQITGETEAEPEANKTKTVYYTFIDKELFDTTYRQLNDAGDSNPGRKAYEAAVLRYNYEKGGEGDQTFGKVTFNLNFASNPKLDVDNLDILPYAFGKTEEDGTRLVVFNTRPSDDRLTTGKTYYVSIYPSMSEADESPDWVNFDIFNPCARVCEFRVNPKTIIKVDGEIRNDVNSIECCENQVPVIQVDLWGKNNDTGKLEPIEENARLDWYDGRYDDGQPDDGNTSFVEESSADGILLSDALTYFREAYPDADDCDVPPTGDLTQEMLDYLKQMTQDIPVGHVGPKLRLSQTSYVFENTVVPSGEEYVDVYAVAIPASTEIDNYLICTVPTEVRIRVQHTAPVLNHGLVKNIPYPDGLIDVPLRVGLNQLRSVSSPETDTSQSFMLYVPVRKVVKVSENATAMRKIVKNPYIYLVETNDPEYEDLGTVDDDGNYIGALMEVGVISSLTAYVDNGSDNNFGALFYDSFHFKEGYYYRMRFMFEENGSDSSVEDNILCQGQDVFTVKVVPEYQRWTGGENEGDRNWNNDSRWERVSSSDLYLPAGKMEEMDDFITDGKNGRRHGYAPLDFTKVIIPSGDVVPHLGAYDYNDLSSDYAEIKKVLWTENPSTEETGPATPNIEFDMVAYTTKNSVKCRPWYANTCEQIHFLPESEIIGQQNLSYTKAWVDIATTPGKWHTLATPLRNVYAGDLYLPSGNARQETELFSEILFDSSVNDRFAPAVYQRGWNKSNTSVYEIPGSVRNVAVKANWSNVYNDVTEAYGGGTGFSIKTDASRTENDGEVLFRLPKSDTFFDYYSEDGTVVGNRTDISRPTDRFMLNNAKGQITSKSAGDNRYFLVGNPFIGHLDMARFLTRNKEKIQPKYWVLADGSQQTAVYDEESGEFTGDAGGYVAPMQGFFVEVKDNVANKSGKDFILYLDYDEDMACARPFDQSPLKVLTRSEEKNGVIVISALRDNRTISRTFINFSPGSDRDYNAADDAVLIDNTELEIPAMVYTIGGDVALSVNSTDNVDGTEIGLLTTDDEKTVLTFEGVGILDDVALYDKVTGQRNALYDGMTYVVTGPVSGRLYLMSGMNTPADFHKSVKVNVTGGHVRIEAGSGKNLAVNVYTVEGMTLESMTEDSSVMEFDLDKGVYILEITDGAETINRKIII